MKGFILTVFGILLIILENSIINYFKLFGLSVNIIIIYISIIPLVVKRNEGAFIGLVLGLIKDILVGRILGVNAIIYFLIGYGYGILKDKIFKDSITTIIILVYVATAFESTIQIVFLNSFFSSQNIVFSIYKGFVFIPMLNIIGTLFIYKFLNDFVQKIEHI